MRFMKTLKNIRTIEELRKRILVTLLLVLIYRLGCYVVLPGISPEAIEPIQKLKTVYLGSRNPRLHTDEILIALSMSAVSNPDAKAAMKQLSKLKDLQLHSSVMLSQVDLRTMKRLGIQVTCEPCYETTKLYH